MNGKWWRRCIAVGLVASWLALLPGAALADSYQGCLFPNVCSYEHSHFNGWKVSWDLNDTGGFGVWKNFASANNNEASSWINTRNNDDAQWADGQGGSGSKLCLDVDSHDDYVGDFWSDEATSAVIRSTAGYCSNPQSIRNF